MQLRITVEPQQGASYEDVLAAAQTAEQCGFDAFFRSDHYRASPPFGASGPVPAPEGLPGPTDAWVTLAALARETQRIRLGTLVTPVTFRLPGPLASTVAQVDLISGGRVELGLGTGWYEAEHRAYGIPFPPLRERFDRLEEQLAIVTGLWTTATGVPFTFDGAYYQLENSPGFPKPLQRPHPPIIIGGVGTRRTPRLAAQYADEFNAARTNWAAQQFPLVRAACEKVGRDPATLVCSTAHTICCAADSATLHQRAAAIGLNLQGLRQLGVLCGSSDEVLEKLAHDHSIGATRAYLRLWDISDLDHLREIAETVLPAVKEFV
ncbi:MAG TPA: LLM class F420-dependent oxidoreductase [Chloroflexota bacterium]